MKSLFLTGAILLAGGLAHAAQVHCEGSYYWYNFKADATTSGNQIVGDILITVSGGSTKQIAMQVTSSDVQEGQYIRATATSPDASGRLEAKFDRSSRSYEGTLYANTSEGNANVDVVCTMSKGLYPEFDMSTEEANFLGLYPVQQFEAE
ncbi:hypothetical protein B9G69_010250 [Bdellovibrio sp. SKB1291214]|uniref:hypothetical protein n=1 Tax=Bdellovibrio sp. SKB1291214 TaxID=1732569 RepID=UPI000B515D9A|nr:hypothetical protein [Bdellovibrio sp. SKB1291214]UYL07426.1 hypothetical protein B9G69_010250 [Bdellovibrio sp. SKB1291214]